MTSHILFLIGFKMHNQFPEARIVVNIKFIFPILINFDRASSTSKTEQESFPLQIN